VDNSQQILFDTNRLWTTDTRCEQHPTAQPKTEGTRLVANAGEGQAKPPPTTHPSQQRDSPRR
jgi:hypothetical protein